MGLLKHAALAKNNCGNSVKETGFFKSFMNPKAINYCAATHASRHSSSEGQHFKEYATTISTITVPVIVIKGY